MEHQEKPFKNMETSKQSGLKLEEEGGLLPDLSAEDMKAVFEDFTLASNNEACSVQVLEDSSKRLKYCPDCDKMEKKTKVKSYQLEDDRYIVSCTDNECPFITECPGRCLVDPELLVSYGFPEELLEHMEVYIEDLNKIVRLVMYEHFFNKYFSKVKGTPLDKVFSEFENSVADLSPEYRKQVKEAFAKIKNYQFPDDVIKKIDKRKWFVSESGLLYSVKNRPDC